MPLVVLPKIVVLDSRTLGQLSNDYWSDESSLRDQCRKFIATLVDANIYIGLSYTHLNELFRYGSYNDFDDRLRFLRSLPMIAWVRPYEREWHVDSIFSNVQREIDAFIHRGVTDWSEMVCSGRTECWETGTGEDMFGQGLKVWQLYRTHGQRALKRETYIASIARTDPGLIFNAKLSDLAKLPNREPAEYEAFSRSFAAHMTAQLVRHGDKRLDAHEQIATDFSTKVLRDLQAAAT